MCHSLVCACPRSCIPAAGLSEGLSPTDELDPAEMSAVQGEGSDHGWQ